MSETVYMRVFGGQVAFILLHIWFFFFLFSVRLRARSITLRTNETVSGWFSIPFPLQPEPILRKIPGLGVALYSG